MIALRRTLAVIVAGAWLSVAWAQNAAAPALKWHTNFAEAQAEAKRLNRPILIDFTGSDWCGWCIRLKDEVFSKPEFQAWARSNVVLLELDFPRRKQQPEALKKQNQELLQRYRVRGFPTILFVDHTGREIGRTGYVRGGPEAWLKEARQVLGRSRS